MPQWKLGRLIQIPAMTPISGGPWDKSLFPLLKRGPWTLLLTMTLLALSYLILLGLPGVQLGLEAGGANMNEP